MHFKSCMSKGYALSICTRLLWVILVLFRFNPITTRAMADIVTAS